MSPVLSASLWAGAFLGTHFVLSHPPVRTPLVARLGLGGFAAAYSLVSLVTWGPLAWIWWTARPAGALLWLRRDPLSVHGAEVVATLGAMLLVGGLAQPAPSSITSTARGPLAPRGATHVTRHPMMMGLALMLLPHLWLNGWALDLVFFGAHLALAVLGAAHQDHRHRARPEYADFCAHTSFFPDPRGLPRVGGRVAAAMAAGVAMAAALRWAHRWF
jgi:uncharacterized membrane protein